MQPIKKRSTTIHEDVRRTLGISRDAYAFCAYVHYRCADSRQKRAGWCCDNKQELADFVGITRPGVYKMGERMVEIGLLEISNSGDYRATPKWIDSETNCKQSLQKQQDENVNFVYKDCKQSLQKKSENVNKVDTDTYILELENKEEEEEGQKNSSSSEPENFCLEAEKEKRRLADLPAAVRLYDPQLPGVTLVEPAPMPEYGRDQRAQPPAELRRVNISEEIEALKTDDAAKETFTLSRKIPSQHFAEYVEVFRIDIAGRGETYNSPKQFRNHFFNWCGTRWEIETKRRAAQQPTTGIPYQIRKL